VRDRVRERVIASRAAELARKDGEAKLAQLKAASTTELPDKTTLSRQQRQDMPTALVDAVLHADANKLPVPLGVDLGEAGYIVARIDAAPRESLDDGPSRAQYGQAWTGAETRAYLDALRQRFKAEVRPGALVDAVAVEAPR
jgi:peptidyl-prolyl cis-trans isomerase D